MGRVRKGARGCVVSREQSLLARAPKGIPWAKASELKVRETFFVWAGSPRGGSHFHCAPGTSIGLTASTSKGRSANKVISNVLGIVKRPPFPKAPRKSRFG